MKPSTSFDDIDYGRATRRLFWISCAIALGGTLSSWGMWGKSTGGGFAIGSTASLANLWIWHAIARGLSSEGKPSKLAPTLFVGRFLALFAIGYVILRTLNVQPLAVVLGLLTTALAAVTEILVQLTASLMRLPK
jgi:hypothetical protein